MESSLYRSHRTGAFNPQQEGRGYPVPPQGAACPPGYGGAGGQADCSPCADSPCRVKLFGGFKAAVGPGATATITVQPKTGVRVHRLMVASDIAPFFLIVSIKIGTNDMMIQGGVDGSGISAVTLSEVSVDAWVSLDCSNNAQQLELQVVNVDPALVAHDFRFTAIGITPNTTGYGV